MSDSIEIRTVTSVEDCRRVQVVQDLVWGGGHGDTMSIHVLVTQTKSGGLLQAAFVERGAEETEGMVGFSFGWPAFGYDTNGERKLKFCSHIMGVLPTWHGRGIGLRLKLSQREELLRQGWTDWVTWTFDPLQRVNGRLNTSRLGGISTTYLRNVYGEMTDSLNAGMPTDRFQVDWYLDSPRVRNAISADRPTPEWPSSSLQRARTHSSGNSLPRAPHGHPPSPDGRPYALPLPDNVDDLRRAGGTLLFDWRFFVRQAAETCLAAGYALAGCTLIENEWHYIFELQD
ncbi:MAG: hypothetical protein F4047_00140 [Caldilineaceae bacterium SB0670_bin_27]|uniref:GNAT family N-acetyltransferase n=1 Tax=Caldilineaceae bacterium SB0664_bin_27 TaxID=2605260 RepID=A0A6B0YNE6_9CHLR|nr:hypothetical protein [Caldilineaceae bacterium SB0664_bin_27]MYJ76595.1 hypothetical protein [Caldilineaceae bacterium SB0670_bin_27]